MVALALVASTARAAPPAPAPRLTRPPRLLKFVEAPWPASERERLTSERAARGAEAGAEPIEVGVVLELVVDERGRVESARVVRGASAALDEAALRAARELEFEPALIDDQPGRLRIEFRYRFVLPPEPPRHGTLRGTVRERGTARPLSGVRVTIAGVGSALTDEQGSFTIAFVPAGRQRLTIEGAGRPPIQVEEELAPGRDLAVTYQVDVPRPTDGSDVDDVEIVVRGPPLRRQSVETRIAADDARSLPGTQGDVLRVVENLPGVARAAAGSGALVVWGAAPADTRVYVDDVPVPRLYHDGGLRSVLPAEMVQSVSLAPGGYGAAYGGGLGGLVNVTTRSLLDGDREGRSRPVAGALAVDLYDAQGFLKARLARRVQLSLGLRRSHLDSALDLVDRRIAEYFPTPRYWDGQARLAVDLGARRTLEITGLGSLDETTRGRDSTDPLRRAREGRRESFYRASARYRQQLPNGSLTVLAWGGLDESSVSIDVGGTRGALDSRTPQAGLRAQLRGRFARWLSAEAGIEAWLRSTALSRQGALALPPREGDIRVFGQPPPGTLLADSYSTVLASVAPWLEADVELLGGALHLVPGLRADPYLRSVSRRTPPLGDTPQIGLYGQDFLVEPRLALSYAPHPRLGLRAATGLYRQPPAPEDLSAVFGSPTLPAATAQHVLAGVSVSVTDLLSIEATGFFTRSWDLAVRSPLPSPRLAGALEATGEGRAYGAQLLVRQQAFRGLFGWLSYTVSRSERRLTGAAGWRPFDYDQTHVLTGVFAWRLPLGFEVGLRARLATGYPRTAVVGASYDATTDLYQPIFGGQNGERIPLFFQLDARVARRFAFAGTELDLYLDIQNVTNQANAEEVVYSLDYTRRGYITGLPTLPVLGARWAF